MTSVHDGGCRIDRRKFVVGAAGAVASAGLMESLWPSAAGATGQFGVAGP